MGKLVADYLLERLHAWGVDTIFGYPGDGINALIGALDRQKETIRFIQARHEEMAAFMACGYAKFTDRPGVCLATSGPGAIHLLNGLYDAKLDHVPVVAVVGQQKRAALGGSYQQEVDLQTLFKDVASEFVQVASDPAQIRHLIDRAMRIALSERTVTCVIIPNDVAELPAVETPPHEHGTVHSSIGYERPLVVPTDEQLQEAAKILNEGEKVAILVGQGARGARQEIKEVADLLGAGVAKALLGKDVISDDEPFVTGSIGLLGTYPSWELMMGCDTLLMVGSSFPYSEFLPEEGKAKAVQIDLDARLIGIRYPFNVNLVGDAKATLQELIPLLNRKEERSWREKIEKSILDWQEVIERRAHADADPLNPQLLFQELSKRLPDDAILTCDSGSAANWYARNIQMRGEMRGSLSGTLATMGSGVPYAIGAKIAHPDRPVFALVGDGAMQMNGLAELITVKKYLDELGDGRLTVVVLNNRDLNQVTWEQRAMEGDPRYPGTQDIPDFPYADFAREMLGFASIRIDQPERLQGALDEAFAASGPVLIEAVTDPDVPPLPPHITTEQARNFLSALRGGDPASKGMISQSFRQKADELLAKL
jgi:pyruvate dehydrogenase (quinone)